MEIELIPVARIVEDPDQPRRSIDLEALEGLANSIQQHGLLQPITVTHLPAVSMYRIVTGERRWRAAQRAGLELVPCVIKELPPDETRTEQLVENLQREDLSPLDRARAIAGLRDLLNSNNREIGVRLGLSERSVGTLLDLMELPEAIASAVVSTPNRAADGRLTEKHARYLKQLNDLPELQEAVVEKIRDERYTGDQTGDLVRALRSAPERARDIMAMPASELRKSRSGPSASAAMPPGLPQFGASGPQMLTAPARMALELTAVLDEVRPAALTRHQVQQLEDCLTGLKQMVDGLLRECGLELK